MLFLPFTVICAHRREKNVLIRTASGIESAHIYKLKSAFDRCGFLCAPSYPKLWLCRKFIADNAWTIFAVSPKMLNLLLFVSHAIIEGWSEYITVDCDTCFTDFLPYRHVRKTRTFFSKYADHVIAKYAAKICWNRPRLHIRVNLTWYIFGGWDSTVVIN